MPRKRKSKTGGRPLPRAWGAFLLAMGGRFSLASVIGVTESTIWRWTRGISTPTRVIQGTINRMCIEHGCAPVFAEGVSRGR